jgi:hypothetical protein
MIKNTRSRVLLPNRILKQQPSLSEQNFLDMVLNYLTRYPNYHFIKVENEFAVCDRVDEAKGRRPKRG